MDDRGLVHDHAHEATAVARTAAAPPRRPRALLALLMLILAATIWDMGHRLLTAPPVPIILLHNVAPSPHGAGDFWTITPDQARSILDVIVQRKLRTLSLAQVDDLLHGRLDLVTAHQAVIITIDDCPLSTATVLAPELSHRGLTALVFAVTRWGPPEHLTGDQLRALDAHGFAVCSHSQTHASLARGAGESAALFERRVREELAGSRATLEKILGHPVTALAYPKGEFDARTKALVHEAGYRLAFTTDPGYVEPGVDPLEIPRYQLGSDSTAKNVAAYLDEGRRTWYVRVASEAILVLSVLIYLLGTRR